MPSAEAWQHVPGMVAGLPSNSAAAPDPVEPASHLVPPAAAQTAPPAVDQAVRLAPPPAAAAPSAPATPERWAEPDGAAPATPAPAWVPAGLAGGSAGAGAPVRAAAEPTAGSAAPARPDEQGAPLPEPVALHVERAEVVPDLTVLAAEALRWLAAHDPAALTDWLVGGSWAEASGRLAAVVAAWTRHGPAGDGSLVVELRHVGMLDVVGRDQVGFVSRTTVHRVPRAASREPAR
jgi:hypothetical protein